jgi:hypothetical protein
MTLGPVVGDEQPALTRKARAEAVTEQHSISASSICGRKLSNPSEGRLYRKDGVVIDENPFPHFIAPDA